MNTGAHMPTLAEKIVKEEAADLAKARARYAELLASDEKSDVGEMRKLLATLGKTPAAMEADRTALAEYRATESKLIGAAGLAQSQRAAADATATVLASVRGLMKSAIDRLDENQIAMILERREPVTAYEVFAPVANECWAASAASRPAIAGARASQSEEGIRLGNLKRLRAEHPDAFADEAAA